jgi:hypothetical protein
MVDFQSHQHVQELTYLASYLKLLGASDLLRDLQTLEQFRQHSETKATESVEYACSVRDSSTSEGPSGPESLLSSDSNNAFPFTDTVRNETNSGHRTSFVTGSGASSLSGENPFDVASGLSQASYAQLAEQPSGKHTHNNNDSTAQVYETLLRLQGAMQQVNSPVNLGMSSNVNPLVNSKMTNPQQQEQLHNSTSDSVNVPALQTQNNETLLNLQNALNMVNSQRQTLNTNSINGSIVQNVLNGSPAHPTTGSTMVNLQQQFSTGISGSANVPALLWNNNNAGSQVAETLLRLQNARQLANNQALGINGNSINDSIVQNALNGLSNRYIMSFVMPNPQQQHHITSANTGSDETLALLALLLLCRSQSDHNNFDRNSGGIGETVTKN